MSTSPYIPEKYLTTADAFKHFGITEEDQKSISAQERTRYQNWVRSANDLIETSLINYSDQLPLETGSQEFTYAKDAALSWVTYKKRDKEGAKNAGSAKSEALMYLDKIIELLKFRPTTRTVPIQIADVTDVVADYELGYSQTQGFPEEQLY